MSEQELKVLIFSINDEFYATDIMEVERILESQEATKLPDAPEFILGVINYEGGILPILSISKKFKFPETENTSNTKIIVAKQDENKIGIIVDLVSEVKDINESSIEKSPEIVSGISKRYIKGLIKIDKKIVIFLNLGAILTDHQKAAIR